MPLQVRAIAISVAVIFFFTVSLIGWISGLAPFTCCKRALTGAVVAYVVAVLAVRAINAILVNAMLKNQMNQHEERADGSGT